MLSFDYDHEDRYAARRFMKPGILRSRHDIALEAYLDKQAGRRAADDKVAQSVGQARKAVQRSAGQAAAHVSNGMRSATAKAERSLLGWFTALFAQRT